MSNEEINEAIDKLRDTWADRANFLEDIGGSTRAYNTSVAIAATLRACIGELVDLRAEITKSQSAL